MAVSKKTLTYEIRKSFPSIRKPENYVDIVLRASKLKAFERSSARKHNEFPNTKQHAFRQCHKELNLLVKAEKAYVKVSPMSRREPVVFNFDKAENVLRLEQSLLLKHANEDQRIKKTCIESLKLVDNKNMDEIKKQLEIGNVFHQASTYEKIFNLIEKREIKTKGYLWFGVRPIPLPKYYLGQKAKDILKKCERR